MSSNHNSLLEALLESVADIRETLAANTAILDVNTKQLELHMKRSDEIEAAVELQRKELDLKIDEALLPIRTIKAVAVFGGIITAVSGGIFGLIQIVSHLRKLL